MSSLGTCNSWLARGFETLSQASDLLDLDVHAWEQFCAAVRRTGESAADQPRARGEGDGALFALRRLFRRLAAVHPDFDRSILQLVGEQAPPGPRDSASSVTFIATDWVELGIEIGRTFASWPIDEAMLRAQASLMQAASMRTGETGALSVRAMAADGLLVVTETRFGTAKSKNAIRVIELDESTSAALSKLAEMLEPLGVKHLFRADDLRLQVCSFEQQSSFFLRALKRVTGDQNACRHSARASTLQERTWPGWQAAAMNILAGKATTGDCLAWSSERFAVRRWTMAVEQAVAAGHAGLQASHGYYLASFALVAAVVFRSLLAQVRPGPKLVEGLGLSSGALRQARSRAATAGQQFDDWGWVAARVTLPMDQRTDDRPTPTVGRQAPSPAKARPPIVAVPPMETFTAAQYVLQRSLGLEQHVASTLCNLPRLHATALEPFLPSADDVLRARQRIKGSAAGRALVADRKRAQSNQASLILHWLQRLSPSDATALRRLASDDRASLRVQSSEFVRVEFWRRILADMPARQALLVRFGKRHLLAEQELLLADLAPALVIARDRDLGPVPAVLIGTRGSDDRVASARDTTLLRLAGLAIDAVRRMESTRATSQEAA